MGGGQVLLCVTPPLFPPGLNFKSNAPFFHPSPPPPFSQIPSLSPPPLSEPPPSPSLPSPCAIFFSLSFPLYKVFQIYHLYIMTYGYDNVLYYGKMRDLFLLLVCFIIPFLNWYCNISMQGTVR